MTQSAGKRCSLARRSHAWGRWAGRLLAGVLLAAFIAGPTIAAPTAPAVVRPDPLSTTTAVGSTFVVDIYVQDVSGLYSADLLLLFDPAILQVVDMDAGVAGVQIEPRDELLKPDFVIKRKACNVADPGDMECSVAGRIWYSAAQTNPTPPATGSGALASVTFRAVASGTSSLTMQGGNLYGDGGGPLPSTLQNGSVVVSGAVPVPRLWFPLVARNMP